METMSCCVAVVDRVGVRAVAPIEAAEDDAGGPTRRQRRVRHTSHRNASGSTAGGCAIDQMMASGAPVTEPGSFGSSASEAQLRERQRRDVETGQRLGFGQTDEVRRDQRRAKRDRVLAVVVLSVLAFDHCGDL